MLQAFLPSSIIRVVVYLEPASMRWGPAKLRELCTETIGIEPNTYTAFVFSNRKQDSLLAYWVDEEGNQVLAKKLMKGAFLLPVREEGGEPFVVMKAAALARLFR